MINLNPCVTSFQAFSDHYMKLDEISLAIYNIYRFNLDIRNVIKELFTILQSMREDQVSYKKSRFFLISYIIL